MMTDTKQAFVDAKKHARAKYPEEMCGFIVDDKFIPVQNTASDPAEHVDDASKCSCRLCAFKISKSDTAKYLGKAQMIIHSHPDGPAYPSKLDMEGQVATDIPWGIIALDQDRISDPEMWGDSLPIANPLERKFMHGIRDCYSVIRDVFRLGREELAELGVTKEWPLDPITLREVPRDDSWWETDADLYGLLPPSHGWKEIKMSEAEPGDVFLVKIRSNKFNHAGVLIAKDLILHHLPQRFSRREPAGAWARTAGRWLRYVGEPDA